MTKELGYATFAAEGGDWGSSITEQLALYHSSHLLAIHLTDVPFAHSMDEIKDPTAAEKMPGKKKSVAANRRRLL